MFGKMQSLAKKVLCFTLNAVIGYMADISEGIEETVVKFG
ncbi:MAG: hypothetical protein DF168_00493 [Candidatus Moanabacter tarae]|uniref:Uncharacterized protein n=1 Tax=Candidatus Moanibacter tarae TaxID=2200854 RepID=A0A2Z4AEC3_9BACT|nr:MAG: hypothetical protein DF168_00493 [Candidatus Moanabacter tarae]|tara:strand:+ start:5582 stop:5701 length:120 start_codon:yes stop_codon:yes gene_type:complete